METVKEKLAKLIQQVRFVESDCYLMPNTSDSIAEHLVQNGVTLIPETGIGEMSDGYHTFNELYHHRALLFATICNMHPEKAWKSKKHDDGSMYDGMFIVGIETVSGQATYHYDIEPYWDMFRVRELEKAPVWDGHTPEEALQRITTLQDADKWVSVDERLPEDGSSVFVMLTHTYESDYVTYGIARYIDTSNGERHWYEDHHGYLEWDKYSDGRGGCSSYKVTRWMPIPVIPQPPKGE